MMFFPEIYKPINEYLENKENIFLKYTVSTNKNYLTISFFLLVLIFFQNFFSGIFFFLLFPWIQNEQSFGKSQLLYEENSWFEIQIWEKQIFLIKNDQFLRSQKIKPILKRIFKTMLIFFCFIFFFRFFFV